MIVSRYLVKFLLASQQLPRRTALSSIAQPQTASSKMALQDSPDYQELLKKLDTITQLNRISAVLSYDEMVFMSKEDGTAAERGKQKSALAQLSHEKSIDPSIGELVTTLLEESGDSDGSDERRILEITKKDFDQKTLIPVELAARAAGLSSKANSVWGKSRAKDDFEIFRPALQECFDVAMEMADAKRGPDKDISLYSQMLDDFETGMPAERIDEMFTEIQAALVPLIKKVLASPNPPSTDALRGNFPVEKQREVGNKIVAALGYNDKAGRIDVSVHPFTQSMSSKDVRITSRYDVKEWYQGLAGLVHESGHAVRLH